MIYKDTILRILALEQTNIRENQSIKKKKKVLKLSISVII